MLSRTRSWTVSLWLISPKLNYNTKEINTKNNLGEKSQETVRKEFHYSYFFLNPFRPEYYFFIIIYLKRPEMDKKEMNSDSFIKTGRIFLYIPWIGQPHFLFLYNLCIILPNSWDVKRKINTAMSLSTVCWNFILVTSYYFLCLYIIYLMVTKI